MPDIRFLLKVSRPRFWVYLFGPYLLGLIAGVDDINHLANPVYALFGIYFLYPANLLVYGVNDIYDYETDKLNNKKVEYEVLVTPERRSGLWLAIFLSNFAFLDIFFLASVPVMITGSAFLFFSVFYSAPPVRAKSKPFIDSAFNVLYVLPGVFSYALVTGFFPPVQAIAAGGLWTAAMHAFSAIPDIDADRNANVSTIATALGPLRTKIFCLTAYLGSAVLSYPYLGKASLVLGMIYAGIILASMLRSETETVFNIYRRFPIVNAGMGLAIFWYVAVTRFF